MNLYHVFKSIFMMMCTQWTFFLSFLLLTNTDLLQQVKNYVILLFFICIIHPCGSSKYKYKQTKHRKHRKLQFDDIIGDTK